jgi:hypothetical protein
MPEDDRLAKIAGDMPQRFRANAETAVQELEAAGASPTLIEQLRKAYRRAEVDIARVVSEFQTSNGKRG